MKKLLLLTALAIMSVTTAHAGFEGKNAGASLKIFNAVNCGSGLTCTRAAKNTFNIVSSGTFTGDITGTGAQTLSGFAAPRVLASATTITAAQCGSTFYNAGAIEIELPEASAVLGCRYTFVTLNAANFDIDPDAADQILVQTDAAGDKIRNATLGNTITLQAVSASQWAVVGILGTWADAN